jgi:hypothetical protein
MHVSYTNIFKEYYVIIKVIISLYMSNWPLGPQGVEAPRTSSRHV